LKPATSLAVTHPVYELTLSLRNEGSSDAKDFYDRGTAHCAHSSPRILFLVPNARLLSSRRKCTGNRQEFRKSILHEGLFGIRARRSQSQVGSHGSQLAKHDPAGILADVFKRNRKDRPVGAKRKPVGPFDDYDRIFGKQVFQAERLEIVKA
jgi:hypothetical protein